MTKGDLRAVRIGKVYAESGTLAIVDHCFIPWGTPQEHGAIIVAPGLGPGSYPVTAILDDAGNIHTLIVRFIDEDAGEPPAP